MSEIDTACRELTERIDGATACCVIDLGSGLVLGVHTRADAVPGLVDVVAAAAVEWFRGPSVTRIEQLVRSHFDAKEPSDHAIREIYVASEHTAHFARTIRDGQAILLLVTEHGTSIGLGWSQLRAAAPTIERLIP